VERLSPGATTMGQIDTRRFISQDHNQQIAIWSFMPSRLSDRDELPKELEILKARLDIGHRQRAQRGVFTRLNHDSHFDLEAYLCSLLPTLEAPQPPLRKYLIPGREAAKALMELRMMNLTFATLYPDLDGAALQANFEMTVPALTTFSMLRNGLWIGGEE